MTPEALDPPDTLPVEYEVTSLPFPVFLLLEGRPVLVVGGGPVAASKLEGLLRAGARVTLVAPEVSPDIDASRVRIERRQFLESDLDGVWFVVAAATPEVNRRVSRASGARQLFVNAVDDLASATAYLGGVVRRGPVTVAISTGGRAPALAGLLRQAFDALLPADLSDWAKLAAVERARWKAEGIPIPERRPRLLRALQALVPTDSGAVENNPRQA